MSSKPKENISYDEGVKRIDKILEAWKKDTTTEKIILDVLDELEKTGIIISRINPKTKEKEWAMNG